MTLNQVDEPDEHPHPDMQKLVEHWGAWHLVPPEEWQKFREAKRVWCERAWPIRRKSTYQKKGKPGFISRRMAESERRVK